jgi:hypothetical protein
LQCVRNTLIRHLRNHHREYYDVFCAGEKEARELQGVSSNKFIATQYWKIIVSQIK